MKKMIVALLLVVLITGCEPAKKVEFASNNDVLSEMRVIYNHADEIVDIEKEIYIEELVKIVNEKLHEGEIVDINYTVIDKNGNKDILRKLKVDILRSEAPSKIEVNCIEREFTEEAKYNKFNELEVVFGEQF